LPALPPAHTWLWLVERALEEDVGPGDVTAEALIPETLPAAATVVARVPLIVAGLPVAAEVLRRCGAALEPRAEEGEALTAGAPLASVHGPARAVLTAERTALNFLSRLSGVATLTGRFCEAVRGTSAAIVDTRKTTPGWRSLEKYAVRCGGGVNHRLGLYDGVLIKDNHIAAIGSVAESVKRARARASASLRIQVEVESLAMARDALDAGADALLVDNQPVAVLREVVELARGRAPVEASGGVTLETAAEIAHTGVDRISIGALTHSAPAADVSLEWNARSPS
jgi:nicotinate-nucleotide pyrophosphorylase (carboxylating)